MAAPKTSTREQRMARVAQVSELYLQCLSMAEVGRQLNISAVTVYRDICIAREMWRTRATDAIEKLKQQELAKLDVIEVEAWRGWQRSCKSAVVRYEKSGTRPGKQGGLFDESGSEKKNQAGDPRFLDIIKGCVESRRKILGLDAPARQSLENPDGTPLLSGIRIVRVDGRGGDNE